MFTLIRPLSALLLSGFALYAAQGYGPLFDPEADMGSFPLWAAAVAFVTGWAFLGARIGASLWMSAFVGVQAVALSAVATAMLIAVREVFVLGYQRRFREPMEAFLGYFGIVTDWLGRALVVDYLLILGAGGAVTGGILCVIWRLMEGRRNVR